MTYPRANVPTFNVTTYPVFSRYFDTDSNICLQCIDHAQAHTMDPATLQPEPQLWFEHTRLPDNEQLDASNEQVSPKAGSKPKDPPNLPPILRPSKYKKKVSFDPDKQSQNLDLHINITTEERPKITL